MGLRNAGLGFRQNEPTHSIENIIYNELKVRGYKIDIGVATIAEKIKRARQSENSWK